MVGEAKPEKIETPDSKPRKRRKVNYNMKLDTSPIFDLEDGNAYDPDHFSSSDSEDEEGSTTQWGGNRPNDWKKADAMYIIDLLQRYGYSDQLREINNVDILSKFKSKKTSGEVS